jgi:plastocyanin
MTYSRISSGSMILVSLLCAATSSVHADNGPRPEPAETKTVQISNFQFQPQELTVTAGTTVAWLNRDQTIHNVVSKDGKVASPGLDTDDRYTVVFEHEGDYPYFCALHPQMTGVVHVRGR